MFAEPRSPESHRARSLSSIGRSALWQRMPAPACGSLCEPRHLGPVISRCGSGSTDCPAARWLSTAPGPAESTAAIQRPSRRRDAVTDRIDAAVDQMQLTAIPPSVNPPPAHPVRHELPPRHHPVLALRSRADQLIPCSRCRDSTRISWSMHDSAGWSLGVRSSAAIDARWSTGSARGWRAEAGGRHEKEAPARRYRLWL